MSIESGGNGNPLPDIDKLLHEILTEGAERTKAGIVSDGQEQFSFSRRPKQPDSKEPLLLFVDGSGVIYIGKTKQPWGGSDRLWVSVGTEVRFEGEFVVEIQSALRGIDCTLKTDRSQRSGSSFMLKNGVIVLREWVKVKLRGQTHAEVQSCISVSGSDSACFKGMLCNFVRAVEDSEFDLRSCGTVESWRPANGRVIACRMFQQYDKSSDRPGSWD